MPYYKITTSCNFVGCETVHIVEASDEWEAAEIAEERAMEDIGPSFDVEEATQEDIDRRL